MDTRVISHEAWALLQAGRVRDAVQHWSQVARELRRAGRLTDAQSVARTMVAVTSGRSARLHLIALYTLAETAREAREFEEAERWIRRALALHEQLGDRRGMGADLASLAELAEDAGELERAVALWNQALALLDPERSAEAVYEILICLGRVHAARGDAELAARCALQADELSVRWAS